MTRRAVLPAAFAAVLLVVGQLIGLAHEAGTRHVTCAQHGEQLEAAVLVGGAHSGPTGQWIAVEGVGGAHSDCTISRALHQSATRGNAIVATLAVTEAHVDIPRVVPTTHSVSALYRIAPKTSPPSELTPS